LSHSAKDGAFDAQPNRRALTALTTLLDPTTQTSGFAILQEDIRQREASGLAAESKNIADHLRDFFERVVAILGEEERGTQGLFHNEEIEVDEIIDVDV
jgi:hypothetical protein